MALDFLLIYGLYLCYYKTRTGWIIITSILALDFIVTGFNYLNFIIFYNDQLTLTVHFNYLIYFLFQFGIVWMLFRSFVFKVFRLKQKQVVKMWVIAGLICSAYIVIEYDFI